ncbi:MAG: hypothetical protein ACLST7_11735 [Oscillospiraceae bacterium]|jgi:hypothetical protein
MNQKRLKIWLPLLLICTVAFAALTAFSFSATEMDDLDAQLLTAAVAAETERLKIGVAPADVFAQQLNGRQSAVDSLVASQNGTNLDLQQYYTDDLARNYQEIQESAKEHIDLSRIDVDSGTTASRLIYTEDISETEKKIQFSFVGWLTTIYQEEGQYSVVTAFNQDTLTKTMVLEDGLWKTLRTDEYRKEFAPDDYVYEKGRFDTLEEALEFVQHMNMEAENPFS